MFGMKENRLTIISITSIAGRSYYRCKCSCGKECLIRTDSYHSGKSRSCGCLLSESTKARFTTHGLSYTTERRIYKGMVDRCCLPCVKLYHRYGGRGIKVCERWLGKSGFLNFIEDMGMRPSSEHTLDRKNNDGDYTPENCRWATKEEQYSNKSTNRLITFQGKTQTMTQWCREKNITRGSLVGRLDVLGWSVEKALTTPTKKYNR